MGVIGYKHDEEAKQKISAANKGRVVSAETRARIAESKRGKKASEETRQKMSQAQKGKKMGDGFRDKLSRRMQGNSYGAGKERVVSEEHRRKISEANRGKCGLSGPENPMWRGDSVGYGGVHIWVRKHLGRPRLCAHCGTTEAKAFDWANVSGEYLREASDWLRLCRSCHSKFDSKGFEQNITKIEFNGESLSIKEWSEKLGIKYSTLYMRLKTYGWAVEKALTHGITKTPEYRHA